MKRKNLLSIALVLLLVAITTLTFAYWDQLTANGNGTVDLGKGQTVTVENQVPSTDKLIPNGAVKAIGDTYKIDVTYPVALGKLGVNPADKVRVTVTAVTINGDAALGTNYVNVFFNDSVNETAVNEYIELTPELAMNVKVSFTLTAPSETDYPNVANKKIAYVLTFTYVPAN